MNVNVEDPVWGLSEPMDLTPDIGDGLYSGTRTGSPVGSTVTNGGFITRSLFLG